MVGGPSCSVENENLGIWRRWVLSWVLKDVLIKKGIKCILGWWKTGREKSSFNAIFNTEATFTHEKQGEFFWADSEPPETWWMERNSPVLFTRGSGNILWWWIFRYLDLLFRFNYTHAAKRKKKIPSWTHTSKIYLKNNIEVEDVRERMEVKYQLDRWKAQYTCTHTNAAHLKDVCIVY